jgi:2-polyprenyl-3-methyl-5-hydroxy-6-metoxy-1,4-benzoquinol methylase
MDMNEENKKTVDAYEQGLNEYNAAAIPGVIGSLKDWVDTGLAMLPEGARILEIGSAHGRDATYMEDKGFSVYRTDVTNSFVDYMKKQGHEARVLDALTGDYGGPYDMVYASAVLLHFTAEQITQVLKKVREALNNEGLFSFSVKIGKGSAWSDAKLNAPRFFTYWKEEQLRSMLKASQFEVVFWEEGQTGHDNGNWYHVIARKLDN